MSSPRFTSDLGARIWIQMILVLALIAPGVSAGSEDVLGAVKARGLLRCGVSEGVPGFSQQDASGQWHGFDVDFCRAVAAAVVGDPQKVEFVALRASTRFVALQTRQIDLLVRNTSWTLGREAALRLQFPAILFYDWQAVMVPVSSGVSSIADLDGATLCVERGTNHARNLERYAMAHGLSFTPLTLDSPPELMEALVAGRCAGYSADASKLAAVRQVASGALDGAPDGGADGAPDGAAHFLVLPEQIAKQPLSPVVWAGDAAWVSVVRWVLYALLIAEEEGFNQANAAARMERAVGELAWLTTEERKLIGESLHLEPGWAVRAVQAVGNYEELYARHFGPASRVPIARGMNRLWSEGGLMYPPPID